MIIFKAGKKGLKFDLIVIGLVQVAALIYGGYTIYSQKPTWVVFSVDRFAVVGLKEIDSSKIPDQSLKVGFLDKQKMVYTQLPTGELASKILDQVLAGGNDIDRTPSLYEEYEPNKDIVFAAAKDFEQHSSLKNMPNPKGFKWLPMQGKHKDIVAILDSETKTIVRYEIINPWVR